MYRLVCLPGLDGSGILFQPLIDQLPKSEPPPIVIAYPPDRYLNYSALEAFVAPQLPQDEPYLLVAESYGGPLAIRLAAKRHPMLKGLVLSATFAREPRGWMGRFGSIFIGGYLFRWKWLRWVGRLILRTQGLAAWQIQLLFDAIEYSDPEVLASRLKEALSVDAVAQLVQVGIPVLCLYGTRDLLLEKHCHRLIGAATPNIRLVGFPATHYLLQDHTGPAIREIAKFSQSL